MCTDRLFTNDSWTMESLQKTWDVIDKIGREDLGLDYYPPQIELVSFDQMLDAYSNVGLPVNYTHWSFGKSFITNEESYRKGQMGLAYELVINSNPAIAYCLESNTSTMQALVLAHACCGHVHFFKNNYLFKEWTDANTIIDYMKFAKEYVDMCSGKYGKKAVELFLDSCHALQSYGVDLHKRKGHKAPDLSTKIKYPKEYNPLEEIYPGFLAAESFVKFKLEKSECDYTHENFVQDLKKLNTYKRGLPEENLLYFFEKKSENLLPWQRELIRIVRNVATYFYPQRQTKVMNEGFASAIHYTIMTMLEERGHISEGNMLEFLHSHTNVCCQHSYSNINPYTLGFSMFMDLKRICLEPTEEDKEWFPLIAGSQDWLSLWKDCVENYRDESFINQFLSPKVIRDLKLFNLKKKQEDDENYEVTDTHRDDDVLNIRKILANQHTLDYYRPNLQITYYDPFDKEITISMKTNDRALDGDMEEVMRYHIMTLWGERFSIEVE